MQNTVRPRQVGRRSAKGSSDAKWISSLRPYDLHGANVQGAMLFWSLHGGLRRRGDAGVDGIESEKRRESRIGMNVRFVSRRGKVHD